MKYILVLLAIVIPACCGSSGYEEYLQDMERNRDWHISNLNRNCRELQAKMRECGYEVSREEICPSRMRGESILTGCITSQNQYLICANYAGCTRGTRVENCSREMEDLSLSCGGYSGF